MKIGYIGGHWHTNIGNSFYNLGALHLLRSIPNSEIYFIPDPAQEFWPNLKNDYNFIKNLNLDLLIISGPSLGGNIITTYKEIFDSFKFRDKEIAFLSAGAVEYNALEIEKVSKFLKNYKIKFIFTRDSFTYQNFKNKIDTDFYNGICASMFLNDTVKIPTIDDKFYVFNFGRKDEPIIEKKDDIYTFRKKSYFGKFQENLNGLKIIRTNSDSFRYFSKLNYNRPQTYWSSSPEGYLSIYKSAETIFSDRVHSCCASLILNNKAMYIQVSKRSKEKRFTLFQRLGIENIMNEPCKLNFDFINMEKEKMKTQLLNKFR